jgi:hypothetical protein
MENDGISDYCGSHRHRDNPDSGELRMTARQIAATKGEVQMNVHQPGDPIRLSKLGESRIKRAPSKTGTVLRGTGTQRSSRNAVRVQFDGMKNPVSLHRSYIEPLDANEITGEGEMKAR